MRDESAFVSRHARRGPRLLLEDRQRTRPVGGFKEQHDPADQQVREAEPEGTRPGPFSPPTQQDRHHASADVDDEETVQQDEQVGHEEHILIVRAQWGCATEEIQRVAPVAAANSYSVGFASPPVGFKWKTIPGVVPTAE